MLVNNFVNMFNKHQEENFQLSMFVCIDGSIVHWCGVGGDWINEGLPMHVAIDRKPENGCEMQSMCCGESGIMCCLKLAKSAAARQQEEADNELDDDTPDVLNEGTKVIKELCLPWANTDHVAVSDSHFASVQTAQELK